MGETSENKPMKHRKHICIGILAHVDAGKTTLSESMLYLGGKIRELGRVDHKNAYLDTYELERSRGITIFSKQAVFELGDKEVTLLDTPGHVDFSAEMERTLQVLDYAILVISGMDGVQGHTRTLWSLLRRYRIPVFLFINKMDQEGTDRERLLRELKASLDEGCVAFDEDESVLFENLAMCEDAALDEYLQSGELCVETIVRLIADRKTYPCYFGSALKLQGVQEFMEGLRIYTLSGEARQPKACITGCSEEYTLSGEARQPKACITGCTEEYTSQEAVISTASAGDRFGAKVYKISRDARGDRLTHLKVTSGVLKVKDILANEADVEDHWEEKVNQIRIYSGEKYETVQEAETGSICAVTGLNYTYPGEGLGVEKESQAPVLEPVLNYRIGLPEGCDAHLMLRNLRQLEEEDPMLRIVWNEELGEIYAQIMGEVQIEILQSLIQERFHVAVTFDTGNIVYKETIQNTVEGVGHFEPLRHYAEVHLLLEPGKPGSGLLLDADCSEDMLDRNWQRLILTHLAEKEHRGVLTGAHLTDVKITLTAGRAHLKHTEGGDFRQATYRAVRQGLMQAENVLLEPYYEYRLELPSEMVGRAMTDIQKMSGEFDPPETDGEISVLTGSAPVATMRDYQREVNSYTRGRGRLSCIFKGYEACHNAEEVIEASGYDPQRDLDHPTGSVFCSHGAGFVVPWDQVPDHMHIESQLQKESETVRQEEMAAGVRSSGKGRNTQPSLSYKEEKELEEIFIRTYGKIERRLSPASKTVNSETKRKAQKKEEPVQEYLLVDGYNVIFAWDDLKELAQDNIEAARNKLMDILSNYQGFRKCIVILVFDAYKVDGYALEIQKYHNIHVVYTKEAETADQYIEKVVHHIGKKYHVTVVTSDGVEQVVTLGQGGTLISSREFREEYEVVRRQIREEYESRRESGKNYLFDHMDEELAEVMEDVRLGRKDMLGKNW